MAQLVINPSAKVAAFTMNENQAVLDFSTLVNRIVALEARSAYTGANVNCVGNVVTVTFTP